MSVLPHSQSIRRTRISRVRRILSLPQFWFGVAVLGPALIWYTIFLFRPIVMGFWMSFLRYQLLDPSQSTFIGLQNFETLFSYPRFWSALRNTFAYAGLSYVFAMPAALLISWCVATVRHGRDGYFFVIFLPVVVSLVAISMLFRMYMDPQIGAFNRVLRAVGLPTSLWISGSSTALASMVAVDVWKGLGFSVVLLATAMMTVPQTLYDAAKVDGANAWQEFLHVTMPLIAPMIVVVSVLLVVGSLQVYVTVVVLGPGPGTSTLVMNQLIIEEAFSAWRFGFAAAASFILFIIILVITIIQIRVLQPRWEY